MPRSSIRLRISVVVSWYCGFARSIQLCHFPLLCGQLEIDVVSGSRNSCLVLEVARLTAELVLVTRPTPENIPIGISPICKMLKFNRYVDAMNFIRELRAQDEEFQLLMTAPDVKGGDLPAKTNALHTLGQFKEPCFGHTFNDEHDAYVEATAAIILLFAKHGGLDMTGGASDDTALVKSVAGGNVTIAIELLKEGAGLPPPGLISLLYWHWVESYSIRFAIPHQPIRRKLPV